MIILRCVVWLLCGVVCAQIGPTLFHFMLSFVYMNVKVGGGYVIDCLCNVGVIVCVGVIVSVGGVSMYARVYAGVGVPLCDRVV